MIKQAFLTREKSRPSRSKRQLLPKSKSGRQNRSMPSIVRGPISWCRPLLDQEKTFVMVQRILDQMQRGISIKELFISTFTVKAAGELKERLESELGKALQASDDPGAQATPCPSMRRCRHQRYRNHGLLYPKGPNALWLFAWVGTPVWHFQNASEQRLLQNEVFQAVLTAIARGKPRSLCADGQRISRDSAKFDLV